MNITEVRPAETPDVIMTPVRYFWSAQVFPERPVNTLYWPGKFPSKSQFAETMQAANLRGFRASVNPRFEAGIPDFMNGILNFSIHFNVVHRKVDWRNPKMKSLNSMPAI